MFKKISVLAVLAAAATSVNGLSILVPSSSWWWQTGNQALLEWDCHNLTNPASSQFSVVVNNPSTALLSSGYAVLIGQQNNDQCMTNIVPNLNVGTGYYLTFTNIVNYTDVYTTSETFEVKANGSPYPTGPTPAIPFYGSTGASGGTATASSTSTHTNAASTNNLLSVGGAFAFVGALTAFLGA